MNKLLEQMFSWKESFSIGTQEVDFGDVVVKVPFAHYQKGHKFSMINVNYKQALLRV